jgi:acyl-CoA synthetase (NDP forming)
LPRRAAACQHAARRWHGFRVGSTMRLDLLLDPKSVAVVGASQRADSIGQRVIRNLQRMGFDGPILPVHPTNTEVCGLACHASLSALPQPVDAVFIGLPAAQGPELLDEAGRCGIRAAFINAAGFADADAAGAALQQRLTEVARRHDIALCGPNNLGLVNVHARKALWTPRYATELKPGPVAVISQSGTITLMLSQDEREIGLAYLITAGNEAVVTAADYLDHVVRDDRVQTVLMFLETIRAPDRFAAAAAEAERRGKRIVVLKSGSSEGGRALVAAHTGALAGEDRFYEAYLRDLDVIRVRDPDELIETALLVTAHPRRPAPARFVSVTLSGGEAALIADNAAARGLALPPLADATIAALRPAFPPFAKPANPLDAWGLGFAPERFRLVLDALLADPAIGAIGFSIVTTHDGGPDGPYGVAMAEACRDAGTAHGKRLVFVNSTAGAGPHRATKAVLDQAGIPFLSGLRTGLAAIDHWLRPRTAACAALDALAGRDAAGWRSALRRATGVADGDRLVHDAGVPMAPLAVATSAHAAVAAAEALGFPVALKGTAPNLAHKTELGLVRLALADAAAVRAAYDALAGRLDSVLGRGAAREILVQKMAGRGVELIVAVRNDPALGSFVVVGPGGVLVEVVKRAAVRRGPIDDTTASDMLDETVAGVLLAGVRGGPPLDRAAAAAAIAALSRLGALLHGAAATIEINPLIVLEHGAVGVDLLIERS